MQCYNFICYNKMLLYLLYSDFFHLAGYFTVANKLLCKKLTEKLVIFLEICDQRLSVDFKV